MKLSATILAAFIGTGGKSVLSGKTKIFKNFLIILEANVSCTNGKNLFEASCDSNGFLIKINQACITIISQNK